MDCMAGKPVMRAFERLRLPFTDLVQWYVNLCRIAWFKDIVTLKIRNIKVLY